MKEFGLSLEFETELFLDNGYTNTSMGVCKNEMQIWVDDSSEGVPSKKIESITIEWVFFVGTNKEDAVSIGCWFEKGRLTDYDGVFEIPKQAIKLLRKNGFTVPREFES